MKPKPGQYEKFDNDVNDFIQFIVRFDIRISEYPETFNFSIEELLPYYDTSTNDGSLLRYFFEINNIDWWEYYLELDQKFILFLKGIKELKFWADHGKNYPEHFKVDLKYLERAKSELAARDFSNFTNQIPALIKSSSISKIGLPINPDNPPHHDIEKFRSLHLDYLLRAIKLINVLIGSSSDIELKGILIKEPYRGSSDINIKQLFIFLQEKYDLKDQDHFVLALTGQKMTRGFVWPQVHSTGLKLLIQGLVKEKCIVGIKSNTVPWKDIIPIFCNEDGIPYSSNLKSSGHKSYEDDTALLSAIKRLKGERIGTNPNRK